MSKLTSTLKPSRLMTWLDRSGSHIMVRSLTTDTNQSLGQRVETSECEWVAIGAEFVFIAYGYGGQDQFLVSHCIGSHLYS
jgi:hypothetical protein